MSQENLPIVETLLAMKPGDKVDFPASRFEAVNSTIYASDNQLAPLRAQGRKYSLVMRFNPPRAEVTRIQ